MQKGETYEYLKSIQLLARIHSGIETLKLPWINLMAIDRSENEY